MKEQKEVEFKPSVSTKKSTKPQAKKENASKKSPRASVGRRMIYCAGFSVWVVTAFYAAQYLLIAIFWMLEQADITLLAGLSDTVLQTTLSTVVYALAIALVMGVPWLIFRHPTPLKELGLEQRLPLWRDIGLAPVVIVISLIAMGAVTLMVQALVPGFDASADQNVGFENVATRPEIMMAFFTLVVLAPVCEELLFRGYLYGKMRKHANAFWTIVVTSVVFGALHLYGGEGVLQWNVMVNITVLALFLGALREYTKSVWAGILVHMLKNGMAFFVLFVAPLLGLSMM